MKYILIPANRQMSKSPPIPRTPIRTSATPSWWPASPGRRAPGSRSGHRPHRAGGQRHPAPDLRGPHRAAASSTCSRAWSRSIWARRAARAISRLRSGDNRAARARPPAAPNSCPAMNRPRESRPGCVVSDSDSPILAPSSLFLRQPRHVIHHPVDHSDDVRPVIFRNAPQPFQQPQLPLLRIRLCTILRACNSQIVRLRYCRIHDITYAYSTVTAGFTVAVPESARRRVLRSEIPYPCIDCYYRRSTWR